MGKTGTNSYQIIYDNSKEVAYITNDRIVIRSSYIETLKTGVEVTVTLETFIQNPISKRQLLSPETTCLLFVVPRALNLSNAHKVNTLITASGKTLI